MFGDIGPGELILILVVLVVVFGPKRIPELAGSLGKGIRQFKRSMQGLDEESPADTASGPQPLAQIAAPAPLTQEPAPSAVEATEEPAEPAEPAEPVHTSDDPQAPSSAST